MSAAPSLHGRLLLACRQAHTVTAAGVGPVAPGYDQIGFLAKPAYIIAGGINLAVVGQIPEGALIVFRGTLSPFTSDSLQDWLVDVDADPVAQRDTPGVVHKGFRDALDSLWDQVVAALPNGQPIIIAGHSKGGGMAPLAAWRARAAQPTVVTFAAPRCGDLTFRNAYNAALPLSVRYEYGNDIVPHLAPTVPLPTLGGRLRTYEPCGVLSFIDWAGAIRPDSQTLSWERGLRLTEALVCGATAPPWFGTAHSIDPGSGYALGVGAPEPVALAAPIGDSI